MLQNPLGVGCLSQRKASARHVAYPATHPVTVIATATANTTTSPVTAGSSSMPDLRRTYPVMISRMLSTTPRPGSRGHGRARDESPQPSTLGALAGHRAGVLSSAAKRGRFVGSPAPRLAALLPRTAATSFATAPNHEAFRDVDLFQGQRHEIARMEQPHSAGDSIFAVIQRYDAGTGRVGHSDTAERHDWSSRDQDNDRHQRGRLRQSVGGVERQGKHRGLRHCQDVWQKSLRRSPGLLVPQWTASWHYAHKTGCVWTWKGGRPLSKRWTIEEMWHDANQYLRRQPVITSGLFRWGLTTCRAGLIWIMCMISGKWFSTCTGYTNLYTDISVVLKI